MEEEINFDFSPSIIPLDEIHIDPFSISECKQQITYLSQTPEWFWKKQLTWGKFMCKQFNQYFQGALILNMVMKLIGNEISPTFTKYLISLFPQKIKFAVEKNRDSIVISGCACHSKCPGEHRASTVKIELVKNFLRENNLL